KRWRRRSGRCCRGYDPISDCEVANAECRMQSADRVAHILHFAFCILHSLMKRLLIVEDKESLASMLKETVESEGLEADVAANGSEAINRIAEGRRYFAVLTDLRMPGADGIAVLRQVKESDPECPVIVMTGFGTIENAVEAMRLGAFDFVQKPVDVDHLLILLRRCLEHRELLHENLLLKEEFQQHYGLPAIVAGSPRIVEVSSAFKRVAPTDPPARQARPVARVAGTAPAASRTRATRTTSPTRANAVRERRSRATRCLSSNSSTGTIPPLRERAQDIDARADFFLHKVASEMKK